MKRRISPSTREVHDATDAGTAALGDIDGAVGRNDHGGGAVHAGTAGQHAVRGERQTPHVRHVPAEGPHLDPGVHVPHAGGHVLPARGTGAKDDSLLAHRDFRGVETRIEATYEASTAYLDSLDTLDDPRPHDGGSAGS